MQRTVDFGCDSAAVVTRPLGVEAAAPATGLDADRLAGWWRRSEAAAQAHEVDLAQCFGVLGDVLDRGPQGAAVPQSWRGVQGPRELSGRDESLLDTGGEDPARRTGRGERAGRDQQRGSELVQAPGGQPRHVGPVACVVNSRRNARNAPDVRACRNQHVDAVTAPARQTEVFGRRERGENGSRPAVEQRYLARLGATRQGVVPDDGAPPPLPSPGAKLRADRALGPAFGSQCGGRGDGVVLVVERVGR